MNFDQLINRRDHDSVKWNRYPQNVTPLWVADMDFHAPDCIQDALSKITMHNIYGYTRPNKSLCKAVTSMLAEKYDWQVKATSIVWLPGVTSALNISCRAFAENENVLISTPIYPPFLDAPGFSEKEMVEVPLIKGATRYEMDFGEIQKQAKDSSLYLLCNPHNPVGRVYERDELKRLADICLAQNMVICADEIHCDLVLEEGKRHIPIATLSPEIEQNTITLMAPSKTYNTPSLGFAFAVIPNNKLRQQFRRVMKGIVPHPGCMGFAAAEAAYSHGEPWRLELVDYLSKNREFLQNFLKSELPEVGYIPGEGTYLAWLDIRKLKLDNPIQFFLKHGVGLSDGAEFAGPGFLRLNFGCPLQTLKEGLLKMKKAVSEELR
jgi:cysteine-S-conjugate beta-lyase